MARQKYPFSRISISLTLLSALVATQSLEDKGNVTHGRLWMEGFSATSSLPSFPVLSAPISSAVSNPRCRADSMQFLESLRNATMWAVKMFDSSSKFPTGFFTGSTLDFGNFDECLSVSAMATDGETTGRSFIGKYCLTTLRIPPSKLPAPSNEALARVQYTVGSLMHSSLNEVMLASCIPSSCTGSDLRAHLGNVVPQLDRLKSFGIPLDDVQVLVSDHTCSTLEDNSGLTTGQAIMLSIITLLASLTVIGTVADYAVERFTIAKGCVSNVLTCFSLRRNVRMLFSNFKHDDALRTVSGTKVIFIVVIIYGHRDLWTLVGPLDNSSINAEKYDTLDYAIKLNGYLIVDTFFLLTGFLLCYIAKEEARRFNKASSILYLYFRRYIRLTPVYMMVVAFIPTLFVKLGSGPVWSSSIGILRDRCIETWWTHALYVNNIVNRTKMVYHHLPKEGKVCSNLSLEDIISGPLPVVQWTLG
ncbi:nose resistant to fluoxetine protein 6-like [Hetaerina americana]|uniref:nose resistant to fluoxetine protein 6-like n=1 Tax=Hetaerina americana TaxID=62018 RepID=UPI003A7F5891